MKSAFLCLQKYAYTEISESVKRGGYDAALASFAGRALRGFCLPAGAPENPPSVFAETRLHRKLVIRLIRP
jgi:hypothetical protein